MQRSALCRSRRKLSNETLIPTSIYLQNLASIQPRTSRVKFARSPRTDLPGVCVRLHPRPKRVLVGLLELDRLHCCGHRAHDVPGAHAAVGNVSRKWLLPRFLARLPRNQSGTSDLGGGRYQQTSNGSFSFVPKPIVGKKYSF